MPATAPSGPFQPLAANGRPIQPATIAVALQELHAAGLAAVDVEHQDEPPGRGSALPVERDPVLGAVDPHGAHDFRHTYATCLEDAGIPARVIDELMGHETVLQVAQQSLENYPNRSALRVF